MASVFQKLNLKDQKSIVVLNAPDSFEPELARLEGVTVYRNSNAVSQIDFALAFVQTQKEVDGFSKAMAKKVKGDAILWMAYPKGTSRKYKSDVTRDTGWTALESSGFLGVRMVAIDDDWSALRFRRVEYIKRQ